MFPVQWLVLIGLKSDVSYVSSYCRTDILLGALGEHANLYRSKMTFFFAVCNSGLQFLVVLDPEKW